MWLGLRCLCLVWGEGMVSKDLDGTVGLVSGFRTLLPKLTLACVVLCCGLVRLQGKRCIPT